MTCCTSKAAVRFALGGRFIGRRGSRARYATARVSSQAVARSDRSARRIGHDACRGLLVSHVHLSEIPSVLAGGWAPFKARYLCVIHKKPSFFTSRSGLVRLASRVWKPDPPAPPVRSGLTPPILSGAGKVGRMCASYRAPGSSKTTLHCAGTPWAARRGVPPSHRSRNTGERSPSDLVGLDFKQSDMDGQRNMRRCGRSIAKGRRRSSGYVIRRLEFWFSSKWSSGNR
jgi:hypothetical protein